MSNKNNYTRTTLVLLWITTMFFMVFADILSFVVEFELGNTIEIPIDVRTAMAIAAIVTALPISMIIFSWVLPYRICRAANIIVGVFTVVYIIVGGSTSTHYIIIAGIEILLLISVVTIAWKWKQEHAEIN